MPICETKQIQTWTDELKTTGDGVGVFKIRKACMDDNTVSGTYRIHEDFKLILLDYIPHKFDNIQFQSHRFIPEIPTEGGVAR